MSENQTTADASPFERAARLCDEIAECHHQCAISRIGTDGCDNDSYAAMDAAKECAAAIRSLANG